MHNEMEHAWRTPSIGTFTVSLQCIDVAFKSIHDEYIPIILDSSLGKTVIFYSDIILADKSISFN